MDAATLLVVIITPAFFRSAACRAEVERFLARERELGRQDLILPVYYVSTLELDDPVLRDADELARVVASRQLADWRELRFEPFTSAVVRRSVAQLAARMRDTFWQPPANATPVRGSPGRAAAGFQKTDRSTQLFELMERSVFDAALLTDFLEAASAADVGVSPLLQCLARREIERVTRFVRQLPVGNEIGYDGEDREWLLGLTEEAQRSIDAVSLSTVDAGMRGCTASWLLSPVPISRRLGRSRRSAAGPGRLREGSCGSSSRSCRAGRPAGAASRRWVRSALSSPSITRPLAGYACAAGGQA